MTSTVLLGVTEGMRPRARNSREWIASFAGVAVVVACLALANTDVRRDLGSVSRSMDTRHFAAWTSQGEEMAGEATGWVRAIVVSQGPLVLFGGVSLVLVYLMLRI